MRDAAPRPAMLCLAAALAALAVGCTGGPSAPRARALGPRRSIPRARPSPSPAARWDVRPARFELPEPVEREVAAAVGTTIYLAGGLDASGRSARGVFSLDPSTGRIVHLGDVPQGFHDAAGAVIGGRLMLFGGGQAEGTDVVQAFDLRSRTGRVVSHLPRALSDLSAATIEGTTYLVGGFDGVSPQDAIYATADGIRFRVAGHLPLGLRYAAVAAVAAAGGNLVVIGGISSAGSESAIYRFDPGAGTVRRLGQLPSPVGHATAFALGSAVYVVGGRDQLGRAVRGAFRVDPATGRVARLPSLAEPVADAGSATVAGAAWLMGGWRGAPVAEVLEAGFFAGP